MPEISIQDKKIGDGHPVFVLAEMAMAHDGSLEIGKKVIDAALEGGADAVNFQITHMEDYMVRSFGSGTDGTGIISEGKDASDIWKYIDSICLSDDDWRALFKYAREKGLLVCGQCNDHKALELMADLGANLYSISAACFSEQEFVADIAKQGKPIFLRIGGATLGEVETTLSIIRQEGVDDIVLIHGFQNYPTKLDVMNLRFVRTLRDFFGLNVGIADHVDGGDAIAPVLPLIAVPLGATVIEKHITHDRAAKVEDFESAVGPGVFRQMVDYLRDIETALGDFAFKAMTPSEIDYRNKSKKRIVALVDIPEGAGIQKADLCFKRADSGILPDELKYVVGRRTKQAIRADEALEWDKLA